jgi:malate dehydrogenase (oxaloacetate-decarboxylating)(NADP+)
VKIRREEALQFHSKGRPGKIEMSPTKPYSTQRDLSLAYSPGVAEPCLEIAKNQEDVYKYTAKGNLVAVISNGTAVLGLGDIGPEASKPVMEGKGLLFKIFADIDVFDIEVDASNVDHFVSTVKAIAPTFGGINLEDIKAPEAFEIERRLKEELDIPVMHDDQHGTAIISAAALINALEITKKKIGKLKFVVSGAGAAAVSCIKLYQSLGAKPENFYVFDSKGLITKDRDDLSPEKELLAIDSKSLSLEDAMKGSDVFLGLSKADVVNKEMVQSMAKNPIVFALANPKPEISYADATSVRKDIIMATGRSDHPNQVNNVLGFPFIFRGALDVRSTKINEEMKIAAVKALAELAKEGVPEEVNLAYGGSNLTFGPEYIIPKPFDPRLISTVAPAVAKAAIESGVARKQIENWDLYKIELNKRLGLDNKLIRNLSMRARRHPQRIVFSEADTYEVLKAAQIIHDEGLGIPVLLGDQEIIRHLMEENSFDMPNAIMIDPKSPEMKERRYQYGDKLWEDRKRKGETQLDARKKMRDRNHFGCMMVKMGDADAMITGHTRTYPNAIRPALQIIGKRAGVKLVAGMYVLMTKKGPLFLADTAINKEPTAMDLADIALLASITVRQFGVVPRIGLLSYSNFGSSHDKNTAKMAQAREILKQRFPDMIVDGEMQSNFALNPEMLQKKFPFSDLAKYGANVLIFPNLDAGNISYKLIQELTGSEAIGPILMGLDKPVHILQFGCSVQEIVNMATIAGAHASALNV